MADSGYQVGGSNSAAAISPGGTTSDDKLEYWTLAKCKKAYLDYLNTKRLEIEEQQEARRYRHGSHWTEEQIRALNARKQPVVTFNRIGRKIDAVVGLVEKLRQDPKAYPRTPQHEQGAELATAALRYCLDEQDWKAKSPNCAEAAAVDGLGGIELEIIQGDEGDPEIGISVVDTDGFFYDPRSYKFDFSDARFLGMGKWVDVETAQELFPDKAEEIGASVNSGMELTSNSDRDNRWFAADGAVKRIRLVDIWYKRKGKWCWAIFTGALKLAEGPSYLTDEKGQTECKYLMFSAAVDQDGDRYGFVRNLKSANDEINQRRSKALHELNSRRIIAEQGAFDDIEAARREAARPDGVLIRNPNMQAEFDDQRQLANMEGSFKFLEDAKAELENFGPNPALLGQGLDDSSGRAIALLQQAGIAELGPYILSLRGWKLRVYRAVWNAVRTHWTAQRWIRITDDEGLAQFVQVNGMGVGADGMPAIINNLGALDVDIILDEGPDAVNMQQDSYNVLQSLGPQFALQFPEIAIQLSPIQSSVKKQMLDKLAQAKAQPQQDPSVVAAQQMAQLKQQEMQQSLQLKQASIAADLQSKHAETQQQMQLRQQDAQLEAELEARKAQQELEIERVKAQQQIQIAREKADTDVQVAHHKAANDAEIKIGQAQAQAGSALDQKRKKEADEKTSKEQRANQQHEALTATLAALAQAVQQSNRPKRVRKGKDGTFQMEYVQ